MVVATSRCSRPPPEAMVVVGVLRFGDQHDYLATLAVRATRLAQDHGSQIGEASSFQSQTSPTGEECHV